MSDVFISYAREDRDRVQVLVQVLEQSGWSVWWDRQIPPGRSFDEVIEQAEHAAKCVIVAWSQHSVVSRWVVNEAEAAASRGVLVPLFLDEVRLPLAFRRYHTTDLTGWTGDPSDPRLQPVLQAVQAIAPVSGAKPSAEVIDTGDIFLSYARVDQAYVHKLKGHLRSQGVSVWADDRIDYGDKWWRTIVANLRQCVAFVVIMTPDSEQSKWVERELVFADELEKPIYPLLLKGHCFPLLVGMQYHDVTDASMPPSEFVDALRRSPSGVGVGRQRTRDRVQGPSGLNFWQRLSRVFRE